MLLAVVLIMLAGAAGGIANALVVDKGFYLPSRQEADGVTILKPGWVGNVGVGIIAALVSWGLYGPLATRDVLSCPSPSDPPVTLALSSVVGAILVGIGGARWLTNEVDKTALRAAASTAAGAQPKADVARQIALAAPFQALEIAKSMPKPG